MHLVLKARVLAPNEESGILRDNLAQRGDPLALVLREVAQDVRIHKLLVARMADADAHAAIVVADMRGDGTKTVVTGNAATDLHAHLAGRQVDLIVKDSNVPGRKLVEMRSFRNRPARLIHVCARQQQKRAIGANRTFGRHALKSSPPRSNAVTARNRLDRHEADVVAVAGMLRARIAEP